VPTDVSYLDTKTFRVADWYWNHYDDVNYGYLRITITAEQLQIGFHDVGVSPAQSRVDMVTVDLQSHTVPSIAKHGRPGLAPKKGRGQLRIQHNLAEHLALFHELVGRTDLLQRECAVHHRFQPSGKDVCQHFV